MAAGSICTLWADILNPDAVDVQTLSAAVTSLSERALREGHFRMPEPELFALLEAHTRLALLVSALTLVRQGAAA